MKALKSFPVVAMTILLSLGGLIGSQAWAQDTPAHDESGPSSQPATDTWITTKVKTELASTHGVSSTDVSVTTHNGVVVLTGVLSNDIAVKKAVAAAQSVKGVVKVDSSGLKSKD